MWKVPAAVTVVVVVDVVVVVGQDDVIPRNKTALL